MSRINTNVSSLVGRNNLAKANSSLSQSLTRLSTGLRINTGKDDPAGLIASENLRSDITSIKKAISNTDRANQVIATADSALGQVSSLLNDIRGLVTESANSGALSDAQISANQLQLDSSLEALNRIAQTTTFQGRKLLDGSLDFLTTSGANPQNISNVQIDQANLGATGSVAVDVNVSAAATKASVAVGNLPDVTPTVTTELAFDVQTTAAAASTGSVDFSIVTADTQQSVTTLTLGGAGADEITITAVEDGAADGVAGNGFTIAVVDTNDASGTATASFAAGVLTINADITGGVTSDTVAAAIQAANGASAVFTAVSDGTDALLAGDEAAIEAITGGNTTLGVDEVVTTESIDITGTLAAGADGNFNISFAEAALGGANPTTAVFGNSTTGYTVQINTDTAGGVAIDDIRAAIEGITEVDTATFTTAGTSTFNSIDVGGAFPDAAPATISLTAGETAANTTQRFNITTAVGVVGNFNLSFVEQNLSGAGTNVTGTFAGGYTIAIDSSIGVTNTQIQNAIASIAEVGSVTLGTGTSASTTYNAANDTPPATLSVVGAGAASATTGIDADLVFELAGANGSEVLSFESGTTINQLLDGINAVSDATGVTAELDDLGTGLVLTSAGYGSKSFVDIQVIGEGAASVPAGAFTTAVGEGTRANGSDVVASVNGISATGDGNNISINTATLDLSATLTADFVGSSTFTITGGGAQFQLGPDVVSNQQARLGIGSVNTAALGGVDGLLYQLGTGGSAALSSDTNKAAKIVEAAIDQVTSLRGRLGAFQRTSLETNKNALNDTLTNLTEAESSIRDVDFAEETANLTRSQILVQSGTRVLAIANQNPQNVLGLLG